MPSALDVHSTVVYAPLVLYSWGSTPTVVGYTALDQAITAGGNTYLSDPLMEITCDEQDGGITDQPYLVTQSPLSPLDLMIRPYPHAKVTVTIGEVDPNDVTTYRVMHKGIIAQVKQNPSGKKGLCGVTVTGHRSLINWPVGLPCNSTCPWTFGDVNTCGLDWNTLKQTGVAAVAGNVLTVSSLSYPRAKYFRFGWARYDDLTIDILEDGGGGALSMRYAVPPEWAGKTVTVVPGCGKGLDGDNGCRTWANEIRYGGVGLKIPQYNPIIEEGNGS